MSVVRTEGNDSSSDEMEDPGDVLSPFDDDDDEGTMDEEEAASDDNSRVDELDDLKKESEIPLDLLRQMYDSWRKDLPDTEDQATTKAGQNESSNISSQEQPGLSKNLTSQTAHDKIDKTEEWKESSMEEEHVAPKEFDLPCKSGSSRQYLEGFKRKSTSSEDDKTDSEGYAESKPGPSGVRQKSPTISTSSGGNKRKLGDMECDQSEKKKSALHLLNKQLLSDDEESSDEDYLPPDFEDKVIMVGSDYQAVIPPFSSKRPEFDDRNDCDEEGDKLLWTPDVLSQEDVEGYLTLVHKQKRGNAGGSEREIHPAANGNFLKDDEQALYSLMESEFKIEESLRRVELNAIPNRGTAWSQEELTSFEEGLCTHGKDFRQIQKEKVNTPPSSPPPE